MPPQRNRHNNTQDNTPHSSPVKGGNLTLAELSDGDTSKWEFECPFCRQNDRAELKVTRRGDTAKTLVWCHRCAADGTDIAAEMGVPSRALFDDPLAVLGDRVGADADRFKKWGPSGRERLPSTLSLRSMAEALWAMPEQMNYLRERGLPDATIKALRLAWGDASNRFLFPVFEGGELVNLVRHDPDAPKGRRYIAAGGWPSALYPSLLPVKAVVLVAGMFDALIGREHDLPIVSTTCGKVLPDHLVPRFAGVERVAVVYDAGEQDSAEVTAAKLKTAGVESWSVSLPLPHGDVADFFVKHHRSREELLNLIRKARP
jgi:hypothetical protein